MGARGKASASRIAQTVVGGGCFCQRRGVGSLSRDWCDSSHILERGCLTTAAHPSLPIASAAPPTPPAPALAHCPPPIPALSPPDTTAPGARGCPRRSAPAA